MSTSAASLSAGADDEHGFDDDAANLADAEHGPDEAEPPTAQGKTRKVPFRMFKSDSELEAMLLKPPFDRYKRYDTERWMAVVEVLREGAA